MFQSKKKGALSRADHSKRGKLDERIAPAVDYINSITDLYTTSSCSGRIVLLKVPASGKKKDAEWLYVTHSSADRDKIMEILEKPPFEQVWLRQEPFILHVCARTISCADLLLDVCRESGLKHSGMISAKENPVVEIVGQDHMDVPLSQDKALKTDTAYMSFIVEEANKKLALNHRRLARFTNELKKAGKKFR